MKLSRKQKEKLRRDFFRALGPNTDVFKQMLEMTNDICLNLKDAHGRIMALNRRNCEVCGIKNEWDAIGLTSTDLFPPVYAETYMALDEEALKSKKPILNRTTAWPADRSRDFMISNLYPLRNVRGKVIGTAHAYRLSRDTGPNAGRYLALRQAADYLAEHYAEKITIESLAALSGMQPTTFKKTFREVFGETPMERLTIVRLNAAAKLLRESSKTILEVATATGFYDQSHLTHVFAALKGVTPARYRMTAKEKSPA